MAWLCLWDVRVEGCLPALRESRGWRGGRQCFPFPLALSKRAVTFSIMCTTIIQ